MILERPAVGDREAVRVIAVDPGVRSGVAIVTGAGRVSCSVVPGARVLAHVASTVTVLRGDGEPVHVVIERPRVHAVGRLKGDANDVVRLAELAGRIAGAAELKGAIVELYEPQKWKGAVKKSIHQARVERDLFARGLQEWIEAWRLVDHNGRDALALARWWLDCRGVRS